MKPIELTKDETREIRRLLRQLGWETQPVDLVEELRIGDVDWFIADLRSRVGWRFRLATGGL